MHRPISLVQHFQNLDSEDLGLWDIGMKNDRNVNVQRFRIWVSLSCWKQMVTLLPDEDSGDSAQASGRFSKSPMLRDSARERSPTRLFRKEVQLRVLCGRFL